MIVSRAQRSMARSSRDMMRCRPGTLQAPQLGRSTAWAVPDQQCTTRAKKDGARAALRPGHTRQRFFRDQSMLKRPGPVTNRSKAPPPMARFLRKLLYWATT
jgi:hypothetical protein